ncbi:MAG: gamma-glutamylcyclotransferase [Candidatus Eisenbacteria bacterium]
MPEKRTSPRAPALFVYGSLMQRKYWRSVVGAKAAAAIRIAPARLRGWKRWWNGVRPSYGGAVLNLKRDSERHLWGGVVEGLSEEACARLDEQERSHLPRARVVVVTARGRRIWAYCYRQRVRGPERRPAAGYVTAVRAGAKALGTTVSRDVEVDVARLSLRVRRASRGPR